MRDQIWEFLFDEGFLPHGTCLLWNPALFWSHAVSDAVIAMSYFSIPIALVVFAVRRNDFQYRWVLNLFGLFIVLCGLSHVLGIWTLWVPSYAAEALVKILTAIVSAATAVLLWPLLPKVVAIPSLSDLERQNELLELEVQRHRQTQAKLNRLNRDLEDRVGERTADLEAKTLQLDALRQAAEAANEAKSRFLSMVSHEIRTPLNTVINISSLLLGTARSGTDRRYIGTISTASKALLSMVQDILDFSQIEAGQIAFVNQPTVVEEIVEDVVDSVAPLAHQRGLDIASYITPTVPRTVLTDEGRVRQILLNLIGNAVNFTPEGSVTVRAAWQGDEKRGTLIIEVIDTGIGIDPQDQEAIFDRFTQVETTRPGGVRGAGLGLSICRRLTSEMGGQIEVDSSPGQGSTFRLRLPVDVEEPPQPRDGKTDAVIFAGAETTARLMGATLEDLGGSCRILPFADLQEPAPAQRRDVAIVLAPVGLSAPEACADICRQAQDWANRVVLFLPIGASTELQAAVAELGLATLTYPVRRTDLTLDTALFGAEVEDALQPVENLSGLSVLVVDDNEDNLFVADHVLSRSGADVRCVDSGEKALAALAEESFDCILLDLRMPGIDGFETARRIRSTGATGRNAKIIAVSASVTPETIDRLSTLDVTDYLAKPFMPETLRQAVREAVGRGEPTASRPSPARNRQDRQDGDAALDASMIDELVEIAGADLVIERIDRFREALPDRLRLIEHGPEGQRADAAHALAGAAGALGLAALSSECRSIEAVLRDGTASDASGRSRTGLAEVGASADRALADIRLRLAAAPK